LNLLSCEYKGGANLLCTNCKKPNESGKFCAYCGHSLSQPDEIAAAITSQDNSMNSTDLNRHLEQVKKVSRVYIGFFVQTLKKPMLIAEKVGEDQFINAIISLILFSLAMPAMVYFGIGGLFTEYMDSPITTLLIKPAFYIFLFIGFVIAFVFGTLKLGKVKISIRDVTARFSAFLNVPLACLFIAFLLTLIHSKLFYFFLLFGLVGLFTVVSLTIYSFKKDVKTGLDTFYCILLSYLGIFILMATIGSSIYDSLSRLLSNSLGSLF
jgi:hypothetical protein